MKSELLWMLPRREESDACLLDVNCEILVLRAELRELFLLNLSEDSRPSSELRKVVVPSFLAGLISEASALASGVKLLPPFLDDLNRKAMIMMTRMTLLTLTFCLATPEDSGSWIFV